mmetsp:Transcript_29639/g.69715  ORF Transcript_29639/g.69715 Transcript_29639/m.69715 type:complete len:331 (+) Transcript_29639:188-1180(+)
MLCVAAVLESGGEQLSDTNSYHHAANHAKDDAIRNTRHALGGGEKHNQRTEWLGQTGKGTPAECVPASSGGVVQGHRNTQTLRDVVQRNGDGQGKSDRSIIFGVGHVGNHALGKVVERNGHRHRPAHVLQHERLLVVFGGGNDSTIIRTTTGSCRSFFVGFLQIHNREGLIWLGSSFGVALFGLLLLLLLHLVLKVLAHLVQGLSVWYNANANANTIDQGHDVGATTFLGSLEIPGQQLLDKGINDEHHQDSREKRKFSVNNVLALFQVERRRRERIRRFFKDIGQRDVEHGTGRECQGHCQYMGSPQVCECREKDNGCTNRGTQPGTNH